MGKKRHQPLRRPRGEGGAERVGEQWRARKQKKGFRTLYGTLRDTREEALADLPSLVFPAGDSHASPTLRDFMKAQLDTRRKVEQAYGTWKRDEIIWRTRVWPSELGKMPIDEITDDDCQAFIDAQTHRLEAQWLKDDEGKSTGKWKVVETDKLLSPLGVKRIGSTVSAYFEIARSKRHKLVRSNPMQDVVYPRIRKDDKKRKSLTPAAAAAIKGSLLNFLTKLVSQGPRFEAMVLLQRDTGFRRGELCAVKWDRVVKARRGDQDVYFIVVDLGRTRTAKGYRDSATKKGNIREVPISKETYERMMTLPRKSEYVFTTESGQPVSPDNYGRTFRAFRKEIGVPDLSSHNLRHTYISLMLRAGTDLKTVQKLVGHTSHRMIMEIYGETFDESMREAGDRFQTLIRDEEEKARKAQS